MQIHELNNFNGTPGSTNYLAIDNGSDTSRISGTDLLKPVNERVDNAMSQNKAEAVTLWSGTMSSSGGTYTLSESVANFDYLEIYIYNSSTGLNDFKKIPANRTTAIFMVPFFPEDNYIADRELDVGKVKLTFSGTSVTLEATKQWSWFGSFQEKPAIINILTALPVRIVGIRYARLDANELTDLRTAHNGTVYSTARAAREADYNALDSKIGDETLARESSFSEVKNDVIQLNNGLQNVGFDYTFVRGTVDGSTGEPLTTPGWKHRVVSNEIMHYDRDITLLASPGYKFSYYVYRSDGTFISKVGDYTTINIPSSGYFRIVIYKVPEDASIAADIGAFTNAITFKSLIEKNFDGIDTEINAIQNDITSLKSNFEKKLYVNENQIALTGSGQFVTKDFDIPCDDVGEPCCVFVGSTTNVTVTRPIRYRFLDANNAVVGTDTSMDPGKIGFLLCPSGATKFRVTLYGTVSGELVSTTAYFNNVKMWKGNPTDDFISEELSTPIFASNLAIEGYSVLPDNPLMPSIAHRGYGLTAPECTGAAVKEAKRRGFTGAENDVALTSDGKFVMWHDADLRKIGDRTHGIGDYTLSQLKAMDFGSWKSAKYAGEKILTFEEWVSLCKLLGLKIYIDTKFEYTNSQIEELANIVNKYGMMDSTTWYINFNGGYLTKLRELYPTARVIYMGVPTEQACSIIAEILATGGPHSAAILPSADQLTVENAAIARRYNIDLECYYVSFNDLGLTTETIKNEIKRVANIGITGIVIDMYRACDVINEELIGR